ncbi:hypothetical protein F7F94_25360 [Escherichia coli]|nr:hypothetical protein F7F94_25360 [Escherichia coli]
MNKIFKVIWNPATGNYEPPRKSWRLNSLRKR